MSTIYITVEGPVYVVIGPQEGPSLNGRLGPVTQKEGSMPSELTMTTEQRVMWTLNPRTAAGNPAALDGDTIWSVESGNGTFEVLDNKHAWLISAETPGDTVYLAQADGDLGEGVVHLMDTALIHVDPPQAVSLGGSLGVPELKPEVPA